MRQGVQKNTGAEELASTRMPLDVTLGRGVGAFEAGGVETANAAELQEMGVVNVACISLIVLEGCVRELRMS